MSWTFVPGIQLLSARGTHVSLWSIQALPDVPQSAADGMTSSMMLGAAVLITTQLLIVGVAAVWFVRSQRDVTPDPSETHRQ